MATTCFVTIDGPTTLDFDDAIHCTRDELGYTITVAIADPSIHVPAFSPIDIQARTRNSTLYRASCIVPMLEGASSDFGALVAGEQRAAMLITAAFTPTGVLRAPASISFGHITVTARLLYHEIPEIIAASGCDHGEHSPKVAECVMAAYLLATQLHAQRTGLAELSMQEFHDESPGDLEISEFIGYLIVQECMVLANHLVANFMHENEIYGMYRRQDAPDHSGVAATATYSATAAPHWGLKLPRYCHSTSPLRRYADLMNIRQLKAFLEDSPPVHLPSDIVFMAQYINARPKYKKPKSVPEVAPRLTPSLLNQVITAFEPETTDADRESLLATISQRIDDRDLKIRVLIQMVLHWPIDCWPPKLRKSTSVWLLDVLPLSLSILASSQKFKAKTTATRRDDGWYLASCEAVIRGERYVGQGLARKASHATLKAARTILRTYLGSEGAATHELWTCLPPENQERITLRDNPNFSFKDAATAPQPKVNWLSWLKHAIPIR